MGVWYVVLRYDEAERQVTCQAESRDEAVEMALDQSRQIGLQHNTPEYVLRSVKRLDKPAWRERVKGWFR